MEKGVQDGGGYAVWTCHIIITGVSYLQYAGGCAVRIWHIINTEEGVECTTTKTAQRVAGSCIYLEKMIFYRQSYYYLDFILLLLYPDVAYDKTKMIIQNLYAILK